VGGKGERERRARHQSGGFFRLSKYEAILYGYLLLRERFFGRGNPPASGKTVVYVYGRSTLTHKHYLASVRREIVTRTASAWETALQKAEQKCTDRVCIIARVYTPPPLSE